ncbi:Glutaminyl-peptide cyclotransferase-like protein [Sphaceloma murrayae]|uniref:Glutaminyl-peptide cyclotransferase-like protein n=1 Tax=Sphaceloma murrayae TaxID=2082308 RepID=A0A2K1QRP6_9PEZI|nr:Glutaminyl-peptide cyclotransferase-like protein [Sphaceloma murrayae]
MYAFSVLGIRIVVKVKASFGLDDLVLLAGYGLGIAQWALTISALQHGLGMAWWLIPGRDHMFAAKLIFSGRVTLHLLLGMVKISCLCLLRNIFTIEKRKAWTVCNILICICALCAVAACLTATVGCHPSTTLMAVRDLTCSHTRIRATVLCAMEFATQLCCGIIPIYLFSGVQMSFTRRLVVCSAFIFPIFNGMLFIAHVYFYARFIESGFEHSSVGLVDPLIIQQVLVSYALVSATVPCLKGFAARFNTGGIQDAIHHDGNTQPRHSPPGASGRRSGSTEGEKFAIIDMEAPIPLAMRHDSAGSAAFMGTLGHKTSDGKPRDSPGLLSSMSLLPSSSVDHVHHTSPASSISSCTTPALELVSPLTKTISLSGCLRNLQVCQPPDSLQPSVRPPAAVASPSTARYSKGKARGMPDWTRLNDYSNPTPHKGNAVAPSHDAVPIVTKNATILPFAIDTTPPLRQGTSNNTAGYADQIPMPWSTIPPSTPGSPSEIARRSSDRHDEVFEAQRSLSLRPDIDMELGIGSTATAEATPNEGIETHWPFTEDYIEEARHTSLRQSLYQPTQPIPQTMGSATLPPPASHATPTPATRPEKTAATPSPVPHPSYPAAPSLSAQGPKPPWPRSAKTEISSVTSSGRVDQARIERHHI